MTDEKPPVSLKPTNKVATGALAGAVSVLIVWGMGASGIVVPPEVASAFTVIVTFAISWFVPNAE